MLLEMRFRSNELKMETHVNVILPETNGCVNTPCKTLWLLHGLSGDHTSWTKNTSIERYANEHNIAVIMPGVGRSWYTNTAYEANYFDFVAKELPELCRSVFRGLNTKREDTIVAGISMGGYGALKLALSYPEQYGSCISLSGALDITRKGRPYSLNEWRSIFGYDIESALELEGTEHDIFALATNNKLKGKAFPKLYMWCGADDPLVVTNHAFDRQLTDLDAAHHFVVSEGDHTWKWWDLHIQDALDYILNR